MLQLLNVDLLLEGLDVFVLERDQLVEQVERIGLLKDPGELFKGSLVFLYGLFGADHCVVSSGGLALDKTVIVDHRLHIVALSRELFPSPVVDVSVSLDEQLALGVILS